MGVRAKVQVHGIKKVYWNKDAVEVTFGFVYDPTGSEENQSFTKSTPSGSLTMLIDNPSAADQFVMGDFHYVDFSKADK